MRLFGMGLALVIAISAGTAQAETPERLAEAHFRRAARFYKNGQYEPALKEFLASKKLSNRLTTILNIAQCYRLLKKPVEALRHYKLYLEEFARQRPGEEPWHRQEVEDYIEHLSAGLGVSPDAALPPAKPSETRAPPPPALTGSRSPSPTDTMTQPAPKRRRIWTWVTGGAAVAFGAVGLGLGLKANADYDEYKNPNTPEARKDQLQTRVPQEGNAATAMFVVAGALAVTSVVLFFVEGRRRAEPGRHTAIPLPRLTSAGLDLTFGKTY